MSETNLYITHYRHYTHTNPVSSVIESYKLFSCWILLVLKSVICSNWLMWDYLRAEIDFCSNWLMWDYLRVKIDTLL